MAEYISFQPSDFFNTKLYTGTGAALAITGVGFQPDMTWIKARTDSTNHQMGNSVAAQPYYYLKPNMNTEELTSNSDTITAFDSDGFTLGNDGVINDNTITYASWNWKAGTTSGLSGGTITPSAYSFNATSGFGIYQYAGTGSAGTIAHGLGVAPECVLVKKTSGADSWWMYHKSMGTSYYLVLNTAVAGTSNTAAWNDTAPTDTLIHLGDAGNTNSSSGSPTYIMFAFAPKKGYSAFGTYKGNGSTDGTFIYTGFRPAYILVKRNDAAYNWGLQDTARDTYNPADETLNADDAASVQTGSGQYIDYLSNGFKMRNSSSWWNGSGAEFIYAAFAEFPLISSNDVPGVAR